MYAALRAGASGFLLKDAAPAGEREVLTLIAQGVSNADIAGKLYISECTVRIHLARIMTKLEVREKAQAVIAAYQAGLVQVWVLPGRARQSDRSAHSPVAGD